MTFIGWCLYLLAMIIGSFIGTIIARWLTAKLGW